jgi:hypothetical protein
LCSEAVPQGEFRECFVHSGRSSRHGIIGAAGDGQRCLGFARPEVGGENLHGYRAIADPILLIKQSVAVVANRKIGRVTKLVWAEGGEIARV